MCRIVCSQRVRHLRQRWDPSVGARNDERIGTSRERSGAIIIICGQRGHGPDESGDNRRPRRTANVTIGGIAVGTASASSARRYWRSAWRRRARGAPSVRHRTQYPAARVTALRTAVCSWSAQVPPRSPSGTLCPAWYMPPAEKVTVRDTTRKKHGSLEKHVFLPSYTYKRRQPLWIPSVERTEIASLRVARTDVTLTMRAKKKKYLQIYERKREFQYLYK